MKYLKNRGNFILPNIVKEDINEINNVNVHNTTIVRLEDIILPDPQHGDLKLSVFPFENTNEWISLPDGFKVWEESFNKIAKQIPLQEGANTHYITIDTKFFTTDEFLRREGIHADGNFCVDPKFTSEINEKNVSDLKSSWGGAKPTWGGARINHKGELEDFELESEDIESVGDDSDVNIKSSWGGAKPTWGGAKIKDKRYIVKEDNSHVQMDWVLPYKLVIPIGDYISETKGGILTVSTEVGCQGWQGKFKGEILSEGAYTNMEDQLVDDKKVLFEKNSLYFMTSNTPHETLLISKGKRRTFMRITLNHEFQNECFRNKK